MMKVANDCEHSQFRRTKIRNKKGKTRKTKMKSKKTMKKSFVDGVRFHATETNRLKFHFSSSSSAIDCCQYRFRCIFVKFCHRNGKNHKMTIHIFNLWLPVIDRKKRIEKVSFDLFRFQPVASIETIASSSCWKPKKKWRKTFKE